MIAKMARIAKSYKLSDSGLLYSKTLLRPLIAGVEGKISRIPKEFPPRKLQAGIIVGLGITKNAPGKIAIGVDARPANPWPVVAFFTNAANIRPSPVIDNDKKTPKIKAYKIWIENGKPKISAVINIRGIWINVLNIWYVTSDKI